MLPVALILWHAGSDVMGCRRPTGGVFTYVSSDRVTLRAFPVATPRGRSSSSHEGEHPSLLDSNAKNPSKPSKWANGTVLVGISEPSENPTHLHWQILI